MKVNTALGALARSTSIYAISLTLLVPISAIAQTSQPAANASQAVDAAEDIIVTGIRASLDRAIDIKRNSAGVVDAISAEDIGKFPDTNLAESLQRITGVSISRVNGEGSQVSVRGFSGGFNLVTLNGRQLPASSVDTSGGGDFARGTGRSFDFQNIASEGVRTLEVYKTGRAAIPSGGIGASINVVTARPLAANNDGFTGSIGAKALYDVSVNKAEKKLSKIVPELSGIVSFKDPSETFGVALFGSYQRRNSTSAQSNPNYFNFVSAADFFGTTTYIRPTTTITNRPAATVPFVAVPNDSRYQFSENKRERINGQAVVQFRPVETLTFTADALFAQNTLEEQRSEQTNWFNRPFDQVRFDADQPVPTTVFLQETLNGTKDVGYEQQYRATKTQLQSFGLNAEWELSDSFTVKLDGHHSVTNTTPNNRNGTSATLIALGAPVISAQSVDYSTGFPKQVQIINDAYISPGTDGILGTADDGRRSGNANGVLDLGDLGTQIARTNTASQRQRINAGRIDLGWKLSDEFRFDFGGSYGDSQMTSARRQTQQQLGDWGINDPGIVQRLAGNVVKQFCLTCKFDKFDPGSTGPALIAFRGDAISLLDTFSRQYAGNAIGITANDYDQVGEKVWAAYGQLTVKGEIGGRRANALLGMRYEKTEVDSLALQAVPTAIKWDADNDFSSVVSATVTPVRQTGSYTNFLPSIDVDVEVMDNLKARVSASRTLARPDYGNLFASTTAGAPNRPTLLGGIPGGSKGNANLRPLVSDNFDVSVEWYFKPSSYISLGFFNKRVRNFVGTGVFNQPLFDLRDPSSGAAGSRSGVARDRVTALGAGVTDVTLFTYTALLIQNGGNTAAADAAFSANLTGGNLNQAFVDATLQAVDVFGNAADPLYNFAVSQPINNQDANIYGFELAGQYFFGETGIGVAGSYTKVSGDVNVDVTANPNVNIFALTGLGDSANATLIYDKGGVSARLSYNWRDKNLSAVNQGGSRNPIFTAPFGTLDFNIGYDVSEKFSVTFEGVNLTSEPLRQYARSVNQLVFAQELKPRFLLGARYKF
jgi:TonB-dependent receptor